MFASQIILNFIFWYSSFSFYASLFCKQNERYLEQRNGAMHAKAKAVIKECYEKNKSCDPDIRFLPNSLKVRLRATVGELYWNKAERHWVQLETKRRPSLKQKQERDAKFGRLLMK